MTEEPVRILFICLGNICRSPLAEAVFRAQVRDAGLERRFAIDSAGTSDYHEGEAPDARTAEVARRRGIELESRSRPVVAEDVRRFDYLIVMDESNLRDVKRLAARVRPDAPVHLLRAFDAAAEGERDVPDPYFGGPSGFERVQEIVERSCTGLLERIRAERGF